MHEIVEIAGAVLRNDEGQYLLVQEGQGPAHGLWNLAAGHVDEGENPRMTATREPPEETGYEVRLIKDEPLLVDDESEKGNIKYAFLAEIVGGELKFPEDEIMDAQWFALSAVEQLYKEKKLRTVWVMNAILKAEEHYAHPRH